MLDVHRGGVSADVSPEGSMAQRPFRRFISLHFIAARRVLLFPAYFQRSTTWHWPREGNGAAD